jgi:membrane-bound hydrogenase subunit beta
LDQSKLDSIKTRSGGEIITTNPHMIVLTVKPDKLVETCQLIKREMPELYHLTTITGIDEGSAISLYYNFWEGKEFLCVKTLLPKENLSIPTLSDVFPSALLYEAEIKDMLGVSFLGNPLKDMKLLLSDEYPPDAPPPLRKEADPEKIRKMMQLE